MIPTNILFLIALFVVFYAIGLLLTTILLISSIKDKKFFRTLIALVLLAVYVVFGLGLM